VLVEADEEDEFAILFWVKVAVNVFVVLFWVKPDVNGGLSAVFAAAISDSAAVAAVASDPVGQLSAESARHFLFL
jgi:hypothetical protein